MPRFEPYVVAFRSYFQCQASAAAFYQQDCNFRGAFVVHSLVCIGHSIIAVAGLIAVFWLARQRALPGFRFTGGALPILGAVLVALSVIAFEVISFKLSKPAGSVLGFLQSLLPGRSGGALP